MEKSIKDYMIVSARNNIIECIDEIEEDYCTTFLIEYIRERGECSDPFERKFLEFLTDSLIDMQLDYFFKVHENENFKEVCKNLLLEGATCLETADLRTLLNEFMFFDDKVFYPILIDYMKRALHFTELDSDLMERDKKLIAIQEEICKCEDDIIDFEEEIERKKERLLELQAELKQLSE